MARRDTAITYEEVMKKNPELKESDIQMLREWCAGQPHLPKISDVQLTQFFHTNYFSMEATKTTIENYYTLRTRIHEFFSNRDPVGSEELRNVFKNMACLRLKKLTYDGYNIIYYKLIEPNPSLFNYNSVVKYMNMCLDLDLHIEGCCQGHVTVFNAQNATLRHVTRLSLTALRNNAMYVQEAFPIRLKRVHVMNTSTAMDIIFRMIKPFLKKELAEKFHFHSTAESLAKFVPLDALPNDDGGNGGNLADLTAETIKWLENNRAWFQTEEATMRVNESLRPGKGKTSIGLSDAERNSKKLEID